MRKKLFTIIIVVIVIFLVIVLLISLLSKEKPETVNENTNVNNTNEAPVANIPAANVSVVLTPKEGGARADLIRMASSFTERFGSFSNQSDFANLKDLKDFMTSKMRTKTDDYIKKSKAEQKDTSVYYGITTKVLNTEITSFDPDDGQAEILLSTQRQEATKTTTNARVYYQDIVLKMLKENDIWKVAEAVWK